ncbi:hypothetical protein X732_27800 [Mesorhizobium sp. L2C066B000]|nr:hypothetical protein X732_27800 [Mesorhizobium sp. L2C066B000]
MSDFSPSLADKLAVGTSQVDAMEAAIRILRAVRPDLYSSHPRAELEDVGVRIAGQLSRPAKSPSSKTIRLCFYPANCVAVKASPPRRARKPKWPRSFVSTRVPARQKDDAGIHTKIEIRTRRRKLWPRWLSIAA